MVTLVNHPDFKNKWVEISKRVPGRNSKQCRERWFNNLDPSVNHGPWTEEEDAKLLQLAEQYNQSWAKMQRKLPGRTVNTVKTRFHTLRREKLNNREWSQEEDKELIDARFEIGPKWTVVSRRMTNRSATVCKKRWTILCEKDPSLEQRGKAVDIERKRSKRSRSRSQSQQGRKRTGSSAGLIANSAQKRRETLAGDGVPIEPIMDEAIPPTVPVHPGKNPFFKSSSNRSVSSIGSAFGGKKKLLRTPSLMLLRELITESPKSFSTNGAGNDTSISEARLSNLARFNSSNSPMHSNLERHTFHTARGPNRSSGLRKSSLRNFGSNMSGSNLRKFGSNMSGFDSMMDMLDSPRNSALAMHQLNELDEFIDVWEVDALQGLDINEEDENLTSIL